MRWASNRSWYLRMKLSRRPYRIKRFREKLLGYCFLSRWYFCGIFRLGKIV